MDTTSFRTLRHPTRYESDQQKQSYCDVEKWSFVPEKRKAQELFQQDRARVRDE